MVTEYRCSRLHCPSCSITTQCELPVGVHTGQCGARLAAFTGLLMGHFRQSKRRTALFLQSLLNVPCSASWTIKIQEEVNQGLAAPYEELHRQLETQTQLFVDETPTEEQSRKVWLWVAETQGIEPTNNTAARVLRPAVIYRKLSFGTQSAAGSRFLERMLTTTETCRLQGRCVYDYLIQVMQARYANRPAPSLLCQTQRAAA